MAAQKQELSLELTVRSEGFKAKLLEAQRELLKLEQKALKAGGASEVMSKKISKAKVAVKMARNEYNQATTALKLHAVQANKTGNAHAKLGKNMRKGSNQAFTQAAYALDDMQYGFQGVQNNIQAMAVSMGASGPLIVGLTLLVVTIGFVVKQFKKAQKEALAVQKALGEKQGLIATTLRHAQVLKTTEEGTEAYTASLKALKANGFDKAKMSVDEYTEALIRQKVVEAKLAANADKIKELLVQRIKAEEKLRRVTDNPIKASAMGAGVGQAGMSVEQLKAANKAAVSSAQGALDKINLKLKESVQIGGDLQAILNSTKVTGGNDDKAGGDGEKDGVLYSHGFLKAVSGADVSKIYGKQLTDGIKHSLELMKAQGSSKEQLLNAELKQLEAADLGIYSLEKQEEILHRIAVLKAQIANLPIMQDTGVGLNADDVKFDKFKDDLAEVQQLMLNGVITFDEYIRRVENLSLAFDKVNEKKEKTSAMDKIITNGMTNLIAGFAQAAGSGENIGAALLSGIGNTLMQLGGLLITTGLGIEAFKASLATLQGPVAIAAGVAMVAAGAAFATAAKKAGGGSGGGSSARAARSGNTSIARPNPVRENARVRNSNLIIPMDKMRFGMQGADDNYSGFN